MKRMKLKLEPVLNGSCTFDEFFDSFNPGEGAGPGSTALKPWSECKYACKLVRRYVLANDDESAAEIKAAIELKQRWQKFLKSDALKFKPHNKTPTFAQKPQDPRQRLDYATAVLGRLPTESAFQRVVETRLIFVDEFSYCYGGRPTGVRHGYVPQV
eukprot:gene480-5310_t